MTLETTAAHDALPLPTAWVTNPDPLPAAAPTRSRLQESVIALFDAVDDRTRDNLLRYYMGAGFSLSDLPGFSRDVSLVKLEDESGGPFRMIARPDQVYDLWTLSGEMHNLHARNTNRESVSNVAFHPRDRRGTFSAPHDPGIYTYSCDVHNRVLGWVAVVPEDVQGR